MTKGQSREEKIQEMREDAEYKKKYSQEARDKLFLIAEIERLQIALYTHQSYDKTVSELVEEVSQLREERDKLLQGVKNVMNFLNALESTSWAAWDKNADMYQQGKAAAFAEAEGALSNCIRALGIGVDNETMDRF